MKKVLIKAYTKRNLGDDLFIKILCERYPDTLFYIICEKNNSKPFKDIKNLKVIPKIKYIDSILNRVNISVNINELKLTQKYGDVDATVHIGGSIFIQSKYWKKKIKSYKNSITTSNNFFIIGSNFGPYSVDLFKDSYRNIFKIVNDVCFRDFNSYNLFKELTNVRYAPDVVFNLNINDIPIEKPKQKNVIISVIDLSWRPELKEFSILYEVMLEKLICRLINQNYKVTLMSFCENEKDEVVIKRLLDRVQNSKLDSYFYRDNLEGALKVIKSSSGIIATRFHAMILGWVFNKPTVPIAYSQKMINILDDIKYKDSFINLTDNSPWNLDEIISMIDKNKLVDISNLSNNAQYQFKELDNFLKI